MCHGCCIFPKNANPKENNLLGGHSQNKANAPIASLFLWFDSIQSYTLDPTTRVWKCMQQCLIATKRGSKGGSPLDWERVCCANFYFENSICKILYRKFPIHWAPYANCKTVTEIYRWECKMAKSR